MKPIPEPPDPLVIPEEDLVRLERWMAFFRGLSSRVFVMQPRDDEFGDFLKKAEENLRERKFIGPDQIIIGWPTEERIAFVVSVNTASPGAIVSEHTLYDAVVFCFGDIAFRSHYFEWDGDAESNNWVDTWSLASYPKSALSWSYLAGRIIDQVRKLEKQVPDLPAEAPEAAS